jgi:hypothetical protein
MRLEFMLALIGLLAVASARTAHMTSALVFGVLLFWSVAILTWGLGLELLGWLTIIIYLGGLVILLLFFTVLMDLSRSSTMTTKVPNPMLLLGPVSLCTTPAFHIKHGSSDLLVLEPGLSAWTSSSYIFTTQPDMIFMLAMALTAGLFALSPQFASTLNR